MRDRDVEPVQNVEHFEHVRHHSDVCIKIERPLNRVRRGVVLVLDRAWSINWMDVIKDVRRRRGVVGEGVDGN